MASLLLTVVVFAPLIGSSAVAVTRVNGLTSGRVVTVAAALAAIASLILVAMSGTEPGGVVGDVAVLDLRADRATSLLLALVACTGLVIASFSRRNLDLDPRTGRFFALFGIVVTGSALVVVPGGPLVLIVGWIGSSWALVGLIGHRNGWDRARHAQRRVAPTLLAGDVALVAAVGISVVVAGTQVTRDVGAALDDLRSESILGVGVIDVVAVLLVVAGASRSALWPFHRWLMGTLAAPTPVSALVHAGFVSAAGLLLIRFAPAFVASEFAVHLAFAVGVATVVIGAVASALRPDVKGALAWSTVGQMAFMVVQCAVGAFSSAIFHIVGHGMYKASLFLGAGDAISAGLRAQRRPVGRQPASRPVRMVTAIVVPTLAVAVGVVAIEPKVSDGGIVLIVVFAWLTTAHAVWGWLRRGPMDPAPAIAVAAVVGTTSVLAYLGGLRLVEEFVAPAFADVGDDAGVSVITLLATLVVTGAVGAAIVWWPGRRGIEVRTGLRARLAGITDATIRSAVAATTATSTRSGGAVDGPSVDVTEVGVVQRAQIRADVANAASLVAPMWPLSSFVAVNPLGGLEHRGFDAATDAARTWLRGRTHLSLAEFRDDHRRGLTNAEDLESVICARFVEACSGPPIRIADREIGVATIIEMDLLHGPEPASPPPARTILERIANSSGDRHLAEAGANIDDIICSWLAAHVEPTRMSNAPDAGSFTAAWQRQVAADRRLRRMLSPDAVRWLSEMGDDPATIVDTAFRAAGVEATERAWEVRGHLAHLPGWAGYAKWRTEWAHADERRPTVKMIEIVAVRAAFEAAIVRSCAMTSPPDTGVPAEHDDDPADVRDHRRDDGRHDRRDGRDDRDDDPLAARADAVFHALGFVDPDDESGATMMDVLADVPDSSRQALWLGAQENNVDARLLGMLDRLDPGQSVERPAAQVVCCIDVRSEGLRRHLEAQGRYETVGFAGFFGVPMRVRGLGWDRAEARCPVLVSPAVEAVERPDERSADDIDRHLARRRTVAGALASHSAAKYGIGAPFVLAESAGWVLGPVAAARTLIPSGTVERRGPRTMIGLDTDEDGGVGLEQRVFLAEAVLNTMGITKRFAALVVLCGHTSHTVNNPHATALECGACAGAAGDGNARSVAALLNDAAVRDGVAQRGIEIPDDTWFVAAVHETVSDRVEILDPHLIPSRHDDGLRRLRDDLDLAGRAQSETRAEHLPGPSTRVRERGSDWAQVRPEWGLAGNAAFVIGPRSMTAQLDLGGRAFLHSYDADDDPTGKVLETIMTAPLVVAHWISSQYYFSTVDPEVFGAGDKLLHNVIGTTGVISGDAGDLRVGLPRQSTHVGSHRQHQPVRLLAVVQAPLERIERIIRANPILQTLFGGSWMRLAGRSHPHEPWSTRTPDGTWNTVPRPLTTNDILETP